jgi:FeS assembly SUF system protein
MLWFLKPNLNQKTNKMDKIALEQKIIENLKQIYDPEIPVNIYELGLIYEINIDDKYFVNIKMTLTSPNCPIAESLPIDVRNATGAVEGVTGVYVDLVFEPEWNQDMITEAGKLDLGLL